MSQPGHRQAGRDEVPLEQGGLSTGGVGKGPAKCGHSAKTTGRLVAATHRASPPPAPCSLSPAQTQHCLPTGPGAEPAAENPACRAPPTSKDLPHFCCPPPRHCRCPQALGAPGADPSLTSSLRKEAMPLQGPLFGDICCGSSISPPPPPLLGPGKDRGDTGLSSLRASIH